MRLNRRRFISFAAGALAAHESLVRAWKTPVNTDPRILSLELASAAPVSQLKEFYHQRLGLPVVKEDSRLLTIQAGETPLTFVHRPQGSDRPFYHFAFNIPENKVLQARRWQMERSSLIPIPPRLRDPDFPDDVVHFRNWNAHSVFFLDPAGNVVEYIGRHDLDNAASGSFSSQDILYASEIGLIVDDVRQMSEHLKKAADVSEYRGRSDVFTALGDESGLLLVMKRGRILNFDPSSQEKAASIFPTSVRVRGLRSENFSISGYPYQISVEG
ncbi:MAG TPA: glyoxalase/bleomycin resistance/dioxygenase family protein [Acidobacteriota bacterium]|nr:glyoxalase/bleomycin resistance/dioxygenase family protein [Acidobacteriota bacterium]